jgi:hypothetical protein
LIRIDPLPRRSVANKPGPPVMRCTPHDGHAPELEEQEATQRSPSQLPASCLPGRCRVIQITLTAHYYLMVSGTQAPEPTETGARIALERPIETGDKAGHRNLSLIRVRLRISIER